MKRNVESAPHLQGKSSPTISVELTSAGKRVAMNIFPTLAVGVDYSTPVLSFTGYSFICKCSNGHYKVISVKVTTYHFQE